MNSSAFNAVISRNSNNNSHEVSNRIALDLIQLLRQQSNSSSSSIHHSNNIASFASSFSSSPPSRLLSDVEAAILRSSEPLETSERDEIEVLGERGLWLNKAEVLGWQSNGPLSIDQYVINQDPHPEVITKRSRQILSYVQELAIRYLRPPTPPAPGEIVITQAANVLTPPAPPLVIRQQPARPLTPEPLVIREAPPTAPLPIGRKLIKVTLFLTTINFNLISQTIQFRHLIKKNLVTWFVSNSTYI